MKNKSAFLNFAKSAKDGNLKYGRSITIKRREGEGITVQSCSNPDYANRSGLTNSGVTFHHSPDLHGLTPQEYNAWSKHMADPANAEKFFSTLAAEEGIFICLVGLKVRALTHQLEEGRVIYNLV